MKDKLYSAFGILGYVLYFLLAFFCTFAPLIFLHFPFWINIVLVLIILAVPFLGTIVQIALWVRSFPIVLAGKIDVWSVAYFIVCAVYVSTILIPTILLFFQQTTSYIADKTKPKGDAYMTKGMLHTENKGMMWYSALKILLPLWAIWEIINFFVMISDGAATAGMTSFEFLSIDWFITSISVVSVVGDVALMLIMAHLLRNNDSFVVKYPLYLIYFTGGYSALYAFYCWTTYLVNDSTIGTAFGPVLNRLVIFLPTYFYLKKRFTVPVKPAQSSSPKGFTEHAVNIFDLVPSKLQGVSDQIDRDHIVENIFRNISDPYTGRSITCEADWDAYVMAYYTDKDASKSPQTKASQDENPAEDESFNLGKLPPDLRYRPCAECGAKIPYPAYMTETLCHVCRSKQEALKLIHESDMPPQPTDLVPPPLYCRLCGAKLHDDSLFCEYCGEPIKQGGPLK